jgi:hypothetical protein
LDSSQWPNALRLLDQGMIEMPWIPVYLEDTGEACSVLLDFVVAWQK